MAMARTPVGREPFVAQIAIGPKRHAAESQVFVKLVDARFEFAAFDAHA